MGEYNIQYRIISLICHVYRPTCLPIAESAANIELDPVVSCIVCRVEFRGPCICPPLKN